MHHHQQNVKRFSVLILVLFNNFLLCFVENVHISLTFLTFVSKQSDLCVGCGCYTAKVTVLIELPNEKFFKHANNFKQAF